MAGRIKDREEREVYSAPWIGGGERSEPITRMLVMPYDTESESRNAPCVPFRGRGPQSGEGVDGAKNDYDTRCGRDRRRRPVSFRLLVLGHACGMRVDGPLARGLWPPDGGRLCSLALRGQQPFGPRVADCRSAAMLIKSALRDGLYESYSLIRITVISYLRWLSPLWCLTAPPSPR